MPGPGAPVEARGQDAGDWTYVSIRRLLIYLERSIDQGIGWVVFEPNGPQLWAKVRADIEDLLSSLWLEGRLQGAKADEAFFVRCDQTTMTQADIDEGRLVVEIGFAAVRPAEFVIFRMLRLTQPRS